MTGLAEHLNDFIVIGEVDSGKSALINALLGLDEEVRKTQSVEYFANNIIDTPGEYVSYRGFYGALLNSLVRVNTIVLLHPAMGGELKIPSDLLRVYPNKHIVGVISRVDDEHANIEYAREVLQKNGIKPPYFETSVYDIDSINQLKNYLIEITNTVSAS
ncbi:Propanediol utilization protein PduV [BD1-7 clade bacterium]|uniref:Propanediol utilization protein PduV n=1 Tax=BD1-7 clade bacterium TaxID=2029982 RepID=A0A5S9R072_9GAMM|nr:Propanediol utilization protein PduV [BD1-7 clade bacterium]